MLGTMNQKEFTPWQGSGTKVKDCRHRKETKSLALGVHPLMEGGWVEDVWMGLHLVNSRANFLFVPTKKETKSLAPLGVHQLMEDGWAEDVWMGLHLVGSRTNFLRVPTRKETKSLALGVLVHQLMEDRRVEGCLDGSAFGGQQN